MYECYNEAYNYLKNKYGTWRLGFTPNFGDKLRRCRNKKEREDLEKTATDKDYNIVLNKVTDLADQQISELMDVYYHGISIKRELYELLVSRGIIKAD